MLLDAILDDLDARGPIETLLAERIAQLFWRLRRVLRFETERLSQSQRELMPVVADLDDMVRERTKRDRKLNALGKLFLPGDHILAPEVVETILDACAAVLTDQERVVFLDGMNKDRNARALEPTVNMVSTMIREGESSLLESMSSTKSNLPALAYEYLTGVNRAWDFTSRSADPDRERRRTEALMLEVERAGIIERYEPRLRRDLSHIKAILEKVVLRGITYQKEASLSDHLATADVTMRQLTKRYTQIKTLEKRTYQWID